MLAKRKGEEVYLGRAVKRDSTEREGSYKEQPLQGSLFPLPSIPTSCHNRVDPTSLYPTLLPRLSLALDFPSYSPLPLFIIPYHTS